MHAGVHEIGRALRSDEYGEVFCASESGSKEAVHVRIVASTFALATGAEAELATLSKLRHPALAEVIEVGRLAAPAQTEGRLYIVNAAASGVSLERLIQDDGKLAPRDALRLVQTLAEGANVLHEAGLAHGRIDPTRVFLERSPFFAEQETVKLVDVGLGAIIGDEAEEERTTLPELPDASFLSPEQAAGEGAPTPESDVWALGALLHFCLTGEPPFGTSSRAKLVVETARRMASTRAVDRETSAIITRCLAREAALRPTTRELIEELREAADACSSPHLGELSRATPDAISLPAAPPTRDHRAFHIVAAFLLAVCVGVAVGAVRAQPSRAVPAATQKATIQKDETLREVREVQAAPIEDLDAVEPPSPLPSAATSAAVPPVRAKAVAGKAKPRPVAKSKEPDPFFGVTSPGF